MTGSAEQGLDLNSNIANSILHYFTAFRLKGKKIEAKEEAEVKDKDKLVK